MADVKAERTDLGSTTTVRLPDEGLTVNFNSATGRVEVVEDNSPQPGEVQLTARQALAVCSIITGLIAEHVS